ncbi:MAG: DNA-binding MarR family transcriptional regulator [Psychromonas sp.]|jgi:DNA-binding MarR family transcriptional regulator
MINNHTEATALASVFQKKEFPIETSDKVLGAIRQITRSIDLHSKKMSKDFGLTSPQLMLMRTIQRDDNVTIRQLSEKTNMSQATATIILDRLEARGWVVRIRNQQDKRKVHALLTESGQQMLAGAPGILQPGFLEKFQALELWEQNLILSSLQRLSSMMNSED